MEQFAYLELQLKQLVSFTAEANVKSRRLMERLGFTRDSGDDFLHPLIADGHPLQPHVFYKKINPSRGRTASDTPPQFPKRMSSSPAKASV